MLRLLTESVGSGYPADYLRARLRGRRGRPAPAPEAAKGGALQAAEGDQRFREAAASERRWLFRQLERELRAELAPLFVYFELDTMVQCLRFLAAGRPEETDLVLRHSMLALELRDILRGREGVRAVLAGLERFLATTPLRGGGLGAAYDRGGLRTCEETLRRRFFLQALATGPHPDLALFFQALVDLRNILAAAKWLRWLPESSPALIPGGRVGTAGRTRRISGEGLATMVRRWTHGPALAGEELRPERLAPVLQTHLLREVARCGRGGSVAAACIEYVWQGFCAARRQSLHLHAPMEVRL